MGTHKALAFDFDGVVVDSEAYKIRVFKSLFDDFPDHLEAIDSYNRKERGVNRRHKFEYIYKNILKIPYTEDTLESLAARYGELLSLHVLEIPLIEGLQEYLLTQKVRKFIVSSSEKAEIKRILSHHGIARHFNDIYAHPDTKTSALQKIITREGLKPNQVLFFGDAIADYKAARTAGVDFIARTPTPTLFPASVKSIVNFTQLVSK